MAKENTKTCMITISTNCCCGFSDFWISIYKIKNGLAKRTYKTQNFKKLGKIKIDVRGLVMGYTHAKFKRHLYYWRFNNTIKRKRYNVISWLAIFGICTHRRSLEIVLALTFLVPMAFVFMQCLSWAYNITLGELQLFAAGLTDPMAQNVKTVFFFL